MQSEQEIKTDKLAFTEAEAAQHLHMKNERSLREYRYRHLRRGVHFAKIGQHILYSRTHIERILHLWDDSMKKAS
jgi:hypothetical protein